MPNFGNKSNLQINTCHPDLVLIAETAIKYYDFSVVCGIREKQAQNLAFARNWSKLKYPESRHNKSIIMYDDSISDAMDLAPYSQKLKKIDWNNKEAFRFLGGLIIGISEKIGRASCRERV